MYTDGLGRQGKAWVTHSSGITVALPVMCSFAIRVAFVPLADPFSANGLGGVQAECNLPPVVGSLAEFS